MGSSAHGAFHPRGWHIETGSDAGSDMTAVASMHEAAHERLQHTTLWGWLIQLSFAYAEVTGDVSARTTATSMLAACRHVHEQFATFTSMITGSLDVDDLAGEYPVYAGHARRAQAVVSGFQSPYHQLHAIRAVARACMQPAHLAEKVTAGGLAGLTVAELDRSMRPDYRLSVLTRSLQKEGWGTVPAALAADVPLRQFAESGDGNFTAVDTWYYTRAARLLRDADLPTLDLDAHVPVVTALHRSLEIQTGSSLGRLAVVILHRVKAAAGPEPATAVSKVRDRAAAAAIRVALAHPAGAAARDLAQRTGELIADAAIRDPRSYAGLVSQVADEAYLQTWGMTVVFHLLRQLPALGRAAPAEAQQLVMAVWDYEVTDDGPEPLSNSRIMTLTFTKSGEVDTARYETSHQFPDWLRAAPAGAVDSYLKLVSKQAPPLRSAAGDPQRARPQVRLSHLLRSAAGHNALPDMTTALAEYLACLPGPGSGDEAGLLPHLLDQLAARLTHHETWVTLLSAGARAPRSLGAAFLPLLEQGELLTSQATFPAAAQLVAAVSPVLDPAAHLRLEHRLHAVGGDQADQLLGCFKEASIGLDATRERLAGLQAAGGPPVPPPLPSETGYPFFAFARGELPRDPGAALPDDQPLAAAMTAVRAALPSPGSAGGAEDEDGGAELRAAFPNLAAAAGSQKVSDPGYDEARELLCAAADALARDPQLKPGTELGDLVLHVLLDGLPPGPAPETETT
jgi:hypothetical protein